MNEETIYFIAAFALFSGLIVIPVVTRASEYIRRALIKRKHRTLRMNTGKINKKKQDDFKHSLYAFKLRQRKAEKVAKLVLNGERKPKKSPTEIH